MFTDLKGQDLALSEDLPPINPNDPDDEIRYFNYNDWRDFQDAIDKGQEEEWCEFLEHAFDHLPDPDEVC